MTRPSAPDDDPRLDGTRPPRPGEELDLAALAAYLRRHLPAERRDPGELTVEQFPSGYSNLTYLLRLGDQDLVLRRPPFGNRVATAHDMAREHRVLSALAEVYPPAPRPLLHCADEAVIGAPFYVMERRRGVILRRELPPGLELGPVLARRLSERLVDALADLHDLDYAAVGLGDLGRPEGYVERQVRGWAKRYEKAQTHSWEALDQVAAWLHASMPAESAAALVHNDFKYDNVVLDPHDLTRIIGVLDWEMATIGDPLMDLGTTLAYWVEAGDDRRWRAAGFGPTWLPGSLGRRELAERYATRRGVAVDDLVFYYVFGLFKLAVIVQQIYYRFWKGHTQDARFAELDQLVGLIGTVAARAVDAGRI